jgi:hypothetical protein
LFLFLLKYKNSSNFTIELLDTEETQEDTNENESKKWSNHRDYNLIYSDGNNLNNDNIKESCDLD